MSRITQALVVIPAHDEEEHIERCLLSVIAAAQNTDVAVEVVVALDKCEDQTAQIVSGIPQDIHAVEFSFAQVGRSRHAGIVTGLVILRQVPTENLWILSTDADTVVPPDWIATHVRLAQLGFDAVAGTVRPDWKGAPAALISEYESRYDAIAGHRHVHGANMSFSASAYLEVGGFPRRAESEDVVLMDRFRAAGKRIARIADAPVVTSTRVNGRTPGGFAGYLRQLGLGEPV